MLTKLRTLLPYEKRQEVYALAAAFVVMLGGFGVANDEALALWSGAGVSGLALLYALLHATSAWRGALFSFLVVLQPLAVLYSLGTNQQWAAVIVFAGTAFGLNKATAKAPIVIDETGQEVGGRHRSPVVRDTVE